LLSGKLVYGESGFSVDCVIRDVADQGAHIRLASDLPISARVWLIVIRTGFAYDATVAWRRPPEFGLKFEQKVDLKDPTGRPPEHLRRLWLALTS